MKLSIPPSLSRSPSLPFPSSLTSPPPSPFVSLSLSQERIRSAQLETSIRKTDELLYHMIPKSIADMLRNGQPPLSTCQEFDSVSILFSDIVSFTPMCSRLAPMQVVCVLNSMCIAYDRLCEKHNVYKVGSEWHSSRVCILVYPCMYMSVYA